MAERLVVVGSGMAGGKLVEEVLAGPREWDLTVVGEEPEGNYNRIKLNYCLDGGEPEDFWLNPPSWYAQRGVTALLGVAAVAVDRAAKLVALGNGRNLPYDRLVLATGSKPFVPNIRNGQLPTVLAVRNLADVRRARRFVAPGKRAVVVGGGLLGLELALLLKDRGLKVTVSQFMPTLMETQLDVDGGRVLQSLLEAAGLRFVMDSYVTGLDLLDPARPDGAFLAEFKNGQTVEADVLLLSAGIRPNIDLAKAAGLACKRGVVVDDRLATSDPAIAAVGECVEYEGRVWGLVAPAYEQARVLAAVLAGEDARYRPGPPGMTRLKSAVPVVSMGQFAPSPASTGAAPSVQPGGPALDGVESVVFHDPGRVYKKLLVRDGRLIGALLVGDDLNADAIALHFSAGLPLPERRGDLLFPGASAGSDLPDPGLWPDSLAVCDCNGVAAGTLRRAIAGGADTLNKLMAATKAGTGCGNCKGKLRALLVSELGELKDDPSERWFVPGIPLERPALEAFVRERSLRSVSAVLAAWPGSTDDPKTRNGLDFLLNFLHRGDYAVEDDSRTANDRYSGNIQKDGRFSVIPNMPAGLATPEQLRAIAAVAEEYRAEIKVTGADRIGLYALRKEDLPAVWDKLQMGSGHAFTKTFRACKACVGSRYCRYGLADSLGLGERLNQRYRGVMGPAKFKMGVSGCPRNCSESTIKDLGVVAGDGGWDVYIGGNGGAALAAARHLAKVDGDDAVVRLADRFYQFYRSEARFGERSASFVERLGFEAVAAALGDEERGARWEAEMAALVTAYRDPWREARRPAGHFGAPEPAAAPDFSSIASLARPLPRAAAPTVRGAFHALLAVDALPRGSAALVSTGGKRVAVFHGRDGGWLVCAPDCPHERGPLVDGTFGNGRIACGIHQYSWNAQSGKADQAGCDDLKVYRSKVEDGYLWAAL